MEPHPSAADGGLASKAEFARLSNVDRSRVSQWIKEKKLTGAALVGVGRDQRIRIDEARAQLKRGLHIGQRLGNGIDTRLDGPTPASPPPPAAAAEPSDPVEDQIKRARLAQIEFQNREAAEKEAARTGRLTDTDRARAEMVRLATQLVNVYEGALPELAGALAASLQVPQRDALHLLRNEFRRVRAAAAALIRQQAAALPDTVAFDLADPEPPAA